MNVTLDGIKVIENQLIPGPTGGAIDADEAAPGPLKLQGDHGLIQFRKVIVWPARRLQRSLHLGQVPFAKG